MAIRKIPLNLIQKELYKRLKDNLVGVGVYNNIPEDAIAPFIQIGTFALKRLDTKTYLSNDITCTINIFSSQKGTKEINEIAEKVVAAIEVAALDLGNEFSITNGDLDYFECMPEDGFGYSAEITYMLTIQQHKM